MEDQKTDELPEAQPIEMEGPKVDRTTVVLQTYYEPPGETPVQFTFRGATFAPPADEDAWERRLKVGSEWGPLDLGWLAGKAGLVLIHNLAGEGRTTYPTEEEKAAIDAQVIEVALGDGKAGHIIRPGRFTVFEPVDADAVQVRSAGDPVKVRLVALPGPGNVE